MDETTLLKRLKEEEADAASYQSSELATEQAAAFDAYYCKPGTVNPNRSQAVTPDVRDAINWALAGILRPFMSSEDFITVQSESSDGDLSLIGDYLGHVFFVDNPGDSLIHDFAFDGLLQKLGAIKVSWEDPEPKPPRTYTGMQPAQLVKYSQDEDYEILEVSEDGTEAKIQHKPKMGKVCVEVIAPEYYAFARRSTSAKTSPYQRILRPKMLVSEVKRMFPDKAEELDEALINGTDGAEGDGRIRARFSNEADRTVGDNHDTKHVDLLEEYIRIDADGDGAVELRSIKRVGDVILENVEIDEAEVAVWSPIPIAHKMVGLSLCDVVLPYQKIRTEITRRALDNMAQVLIPRKVINKRAIDQEDNSFQQVVSGDPGSYAVVDGDVREAVMDLTTPDVTQSAAHMLEYFDQRKQEASGVSAQNQGMDPAAANKTATGIDLLQSASNVRIEMMARWLAAGLEDVFNRILKLIVTHQDQSRVVKLRGKPMEVSPALWPDDIMVRVHVGMANATRERQVASLANILAAQKELLVGMGPSNPVSGVKQVRHTLARMVEAMGYKDPTAFFMEVPEGYQPPEPGPDPKVAEAKGKLQLQQAEAQAKNQLAQIDMQAKQQMAQAELAHKSELARVQAQLDAQIAAQKADTERQVAALKADNEFKIAQFRIQAETAVARERMNAEMELARWKSAQDVKLKKHQINQTAKAKGGKPNGKANGSAPAGMGDDVQFGGQIG